jgi:hypothetical protein
MHGWMDGWMDGWMNAWMDGWMDGWIDEWMDGWMNEWMDGWMHGWIVCLSVRTRNTFVFLLFLTNQLTMVVAIYVLASYPHVSTYLVEIN